MMNITDHFIFMFLKSCREGVSSPSSGVSAELYMTRQ